jgi:hypothetical protein
MSPSEDKYALAFFDELDAHLNTLKHSRFIASCYDGEIVPGTEWEEEITIRLNSADIVLLLISPNFIKSNNWMMQALNRHKTGVTHIIPVLLRPVDWKNAPYPRDSPSHSSPSCDLT